MVDDAVPREAFFAHHDPLNAKAFGAHVTENLQPIQPVSQPSKVHVGGRFYCVKTCEDINMDLQSLGMILRVAPSNKPVELKAADESLNQIDVSPSNLPLLDFFHVLRYRLRGAETSSTIGMLT
ncbi:hypothetical protein DM860_016782 [Cuscuta australis]|uniref:Uncharacterized protein n=1 Tax=Cuscuta australis TaxID=267555 RepID=A0A328DXP7_9ASTE|nr:hypothetical protein DM860_016782 [Cuscuta australis]